MGLDDDHPGPDPSYSAGSGSPPLRNRALRYRIRAIPSAKRRALAGHLCAVDGDCLSNDRVLDRHRFDTLFRTAVILMLRTFELFPSKQIDGTRLADGFRGDDGGDAFATSYDNHPIANTNLRPQDLDESSLVVRDVLKEVRNRKFGSLASPNFLSLEIGIPEYLTSAIVGSTLRIVLRYKYPATRFDKDSKVEFMIS